MLTHAARLLRLFVIHRSDWRVPSGAGGWMQVFLDKTKRQKAPLIKKEKAMLLFSLRVLACVQNMLTPAYRRTALARYLPLPFRASHQKPRVGSPHWQALQGVNACVCVCVCVLVCMCVCVSVCLCVVCVCVTCVVYVYVHV